MQTENLVCLQACPLGRSKLIDDETFKLLAKARLSSFFCWKTNRKVLFPVIAARA